MSQQDASIFESNWNERIDDFEAMGLTQELLTGIWHTFPGHIKLRYPSELQSLVIKPICMGRHVLAQAPPYAGKTIALAIGFLSRIDTSKTETQALILAPEDLQSHVYNIFKELAYKMPDVSIKYFVDYASIDEVPHIAIAPPDIVLNLINAGHLKVDKLQMLGIDASQEMLSIDSISTIEQLIEHINLQSIQICLFSAVIPFNNIRHLLEFMTDPVKIRIKDEKLAGYNQLYINVGNVVDKIDMLSEFFSFMHIDKSIIFTNSQDTAWKIHDKEYLLTIANSLDPNKYYLERHLISVGIIPRDIKFTVIFNYEIPTLYEEYYERIVHYGPKTLVINICDNEEAAMIPDIEKFFDTTIQELPLNDDFIPTIEKNYHPND